MKQQNSSVSELFNDACKAWDAGQFERAFELFSEGAEQGDPSCQLNLGYFYGNGLGVKKDRELELVWYRNSYRSSNSTDPSSAANIGIWYRESRDYGRALWWLRRASKLGDGDAFCEIAKHYEKGWGVQRDVSRAKFYYQQAVDCDAMYITPDSRAFANARLRELED